MFKTAIRKGSILILALIMVLVYSAPVFARTIVDEGGRVWESAENEVRVDTPVQAVTTMDELKAQLGDEDISTITLGKTIEGTETVSISSDKTLKLNGYTLNAPVSIAGKVTIQGSGTLNGDITVESGGDLTLSDGSYTGNITNDGTLTITGGSFSGKITNNGRLFIRNGSFTGAIDNTATLAIYDGSFSNMITNTSTAQIQGGTFNTGYGSYHFNTTDGTLSIYGGTYNGSLYSPHIKQGTIQVFGGMFADSRVSNHLYPSYVAAFLKDRYMYNVIKNGDNAWTKELQIRDVTYGTDPAPYAESYNGKVEYRYYNDKGLLLNYVPKDVGVYYVDAFVASGSLGTTQWGALYSNRVRFQILKNNSNVTKTSLTMNNWTFGQTPSTPSMATSLGTPQYTYYDAEKKVLAAAPTMPGTYYVQGKVAATQNYNGVDSALVPYTINRPSIVARAKASGTKAYVKWTKVGGADRYRVYYGRCGSSYKRIRTTSGTCMTKYGLKKRKTYKFKVKAYKIVDGEYVYLGTSNVAHMIGGGYGRTRTDAKSISARQDDFTLPVGQVEVVKARRTKMKTGKYYLTHTASYRFKSSDPSVATVDEYGRVTGVRAGKADIYIYAGNGMWTTTTVTVQ